MGKHHPPARTRDLHSPSGSGKPTCEEGPADRRPVRLDAHIEQCPLDPASVETVNGFAACAPVSLRIVIEGNGRRRAETRWHTANGGNAALARETIELLDDPQRLKRLRRCANPTCSMLFLAETRRRQWCTANICGHRTRVARHYRRTHRAASRS